ncbi:MAG: response regulator, partial [Chloroflexi bacterium]|nr:response regulator [Chloroflexota bacterium]
MKRRILIVDDDLETLKMIELILQRKGFEVYSEQDGARVLACARDK